MTVVELPGEPTVSEDVPEAGTTLAVLSLGSNLGNRRAHLTLGVRLLSRYTMLEAVSRVVESEPWGPVVQDPFLNVAVRVRTDMTPFELLSCVQRVEAIAGRTRETRFGPRTLDVDLVFFGELTMETPTLTLPHPRWRTRPFVSFLLPDVVGDMRNPGSGSRWIDELDRGPFPAGVREVGPLDTNLHVERTCTGGDGRPGATDVPDGPEWESDE